MWLGKGLGAIGGAVLYAAFAVALWRQVAAARWAVAAMPVIPVAVFVGLGGAKLREELVDAGMIAVFVVQVLAAIAAVLSGPSSGAGAPGDPGR